MLCLLILADGFTGALDTRVRFAMRGIPIQVLTTKAHHFIEEDAEVLVIGTEARHLSPREVGKIVRALTGSAIHAGVSCVYKKTDSALRGNVGAELETALLGSGESVFPFFSTSPELGRTTVGGHQYINGILVNESPFGKDPFEPVRTVEVATLLGLQSSLPVESFPSLEADGIVPSRCGILIFDVGSEEELLADGRALFWDTVPWVLAGCAGSAAHLPELLGFGARRDSNLPKLSPRFPVLCGSVNLITHRQFSVAADEGSGHVHLTPQEKVLPNSFAIAAGDVALRALWEQLREHLYFITGSNDAGDNTETKNYAENLGLSLDELRLRIANTPGTVLAELIEEPTFDTLLLTGGDTLSQCMNALGVWKVKPVGELESGIVLYCFSYREKEHAAITKSGGFGEEDLLPRLMRFLEEKTEGEKR